MKPAKVTIHTLLKKKEQGEKIAMLTAYDYPMARIMEAAGVDVILVGDSLAMVGLGYENTLPVTMEEMLHHTKAVSRGMSRALLVADMPYMSYQVDPKEAVANAGRFVKEAGAEGVKMEGGSWIAEAVSRTLDAQIPVMGHLGLTPQSYHRMGGYKIQGRTTEAAEHLVEEAVMLERLGVFSIVLEGVPSQVAKAISEELKIPTIGIGAGVHCDGQVLVTNDLLGLSVDFAPKFLKRYRQFAQEAEKAFAEYIAEVKAAQFPGEEHSFFLNPEEAEKFEGRKKLRLWETVRREQ